MNSQFDLCEFKVAQSAEELKNGDAIKCHRDATDTFEIVLERTGEVEAVMDLCAECRDNLASRRSIREVRPREEEP